MKLLLTITAIFISIVSFSQISFDVNAGINIGNLRSKNDGNKQEGLKAAVGYTIPLHVNIPITKSLIFQTGLEYESIHYKFQHTYHYVYVEGEEIDRFDMKYRLDYINIPVKIYYKINPMFQVGFGPFVGIGISGKNKGTNVQTEVSMIDVTEKVVYYNNKVKFGSNVDEIKRLSLGLGLNFSYIFSKKIILGLYSNLGLTNIYNFDKSTARTFTGGLTLGYQFAKKVHK
ncbi:MAG: porin family protein [Ferruginibacter sp.]